MLPPIMPLQSDASLSIMEPLTQDEEDKISSIGKLSPTCSSKNQSHRTCSSKNRPPLLRQGRNRLVRRNPIAAGEKSEAAVGGRTADLESREGWGVDWRGEGEGIAEEADDVDLHLLSVVHALDNAARCIQEEDRSDGDDGRQLLLLSLPPPSTHPLIPFHCKPTSPFYLTLLLLTNSQIQNKEDEIHFVNVDEEETGDQVSLCPSNQRSSSSSLLILYFNFEASKPGSF
ncbi:hypothetical protein LINPERPRIM_LOCUS13727 [Linum perenne]